MLMISSLLRRMRFCLFDFVMANLLHQGCHRWEIYQDGLVVRLRITGLEAFSQRTLICGFSALKSGKKLGFITANSASFHIFEMIRKSTRHL